MVFSVSSQGAGAREPLGPFPEDAPVPRLHPPACSAPRGSASCHHNPGGSFSTCGFGGTPRSLLLLSLVPGVCGSPVLHRLLQESRLFPRSWLETPGPPARPGDKLSPSGSKGAQAVLQASRHLKAWHRLGFREEWGAGPCWPGAHVAAGQPQRPGAGAGLLSWPGPWEQRAGLKAGPRWASPSPPRGQASPLDLGGVCWMDACTGSLPGLMQGQRISENA